MSAGCTRSVIAPTEGTTLPRSRPSSRYRLSEQRSIPVCGVQSQLPVTPARSTWSSSVDPPLRAPGAVARRGTSGSSCASRGPRRMPDPPPCTAVGYRSPLVTLEITRSLGSVAYERWARTWRVVHGPTGSSCTAPPVREMIQRPSALGCGARLRVALDERVAGQLAELVLAPGRKVLPMHDLLRSE